MESTIEFAPQPRQKQPDCSFLKFTLGWGSRGRAERKVRNLRWPYQTWTIALDQPGVAVGQRMAKWGKVHLADQKFQKDITSVSWSVFMESIWLESPQGMSCCLFECINKNLSPTQVVTIDFFGTANLRIFDISWPGFARICSNHNRVKAKMYIFTIFYNISKLKRLAKAWRFWFDGRALIPRQRLAQRHQLRHQLEHGMSPDAAHSLLWWAPNLWSSGGNSIWIYIT